MCMHFFFTNNSVIIVIIVYSIHVLFFYDVIFKAETRESDVTKHGGL